jgi:hypothetical protein
MVGSKVRPTACQWPGVLVGDKLVEIVAREIRDEEYVSQYGSRLTGQPEFRDRPREKDHGALSSILGQVTAAEARRRVRQAGSPNSGDGVRYAKVGDLRAHGFTVTHSPWPRNTKHVSIRYPGDWDDQVAGTFNPPRLPPRQAQHRHGPVMTRKISFKPASRRSSHASPNQTCPPGTVRVTEPTASRTSSAQVAQVFGTHR